MSGGGGEGAGLVSVIIPVYNSAQFVVKAIGSVQAQTYSNWEVIVVDDASTDETPEVLRDLAKRDPRIVPIFLPNNSGARPGVPKNVGLTRVRGEFIAFLDADDEWQPGKLQAQVDQLRRDPSLALSYVLYAMIDAQGRRISDDVLPRPHNRFRGDAFRSLYYKQVIPNSAMLLRTSVQRAIGALDENPELTEDADLLLRLARAGRVDFVDGEPLLSYRVMAGSHSSGVWRPWRRMLAVSRKHARHAGVLPHWRNVLVYTGIYALRALAAPARRLLGHSRADAGL